MRVLTVTRAEHYARAEALIEEAVEAADADLPAQAMLAATLAAAHASLAAVGDGVYARALTDARMR